MELYIDRDEVICLSKMVHKPLAPLTTCVQTLRKIARNVSDHINLQIHFSTIYRWIQKYIPVISSYVNSLKPQLGNRWRADELFVKMKVRETRKVIPISHIYGM